MLTAPGNLNFIVFVSPLYLNPNFVLKYNGTFEELKGRFSNYYLNENCDVQFTAECLDKTETSGIGILTAVKIVSSHTYSGGSQVDGSLSSFMCSGCTGPISINFIIAIIDRPMDTLDFNVLAAAFLHKDEGQISRLFKVNNGKNLTISAYLSFVLI